jgi:hypothetical protein
VVAIVRAWTARPAEIEFVFINFWFSGDERPVCRVTGPGRFPRPNRAKDFEIVLGLALQSPDTHSLAIPLQYGFGGPGIIRGIKVRGIGTTSLGRRTDTAALFHLLGTGDGLRDLLAGN